MGRINIDDIVGLEFSDGTMTCRKCVEQDEWENMTEDEIILEDDGDDLIFCDHCKGRL